MYALRLLWLAAVLSLCLPFATVANDEALEYNRVALTAEASKEVDNDRLQATLVVQHDGSNASQLADAVNQTMAWALAQAKAVPAVSAQTLDYRTQPRYQKSTLVGWRVRQSLRLESADSAVLSDLLARLQERLQVEHVGYRVSEDARRAAEAELIAQALARFQERARLIADQLDRQGYRLVQLNVSTGGAQPLPRFRGMAMAEAAVAPAAIEAGTQTLSVSVSGSIELTED